MDLDRNYLVVDLLFCLTYRIFRLVTDLAGTTKDAEFIFFTEI